MRKLYYLILLAVLTACTPKEVNFWGVSLAGDVNTIIANISTTEVLDLDQDAIVYEDPNNAQGTCTFMGMPMEFTLTQEETYLNDTTQGITALVFEGVGLTMPLAEFDKQYGKHKVEGIGNYWDYPNGEIGMGMLGDTLYIHYFRYY